MYNFILSSALSFFRLELNMCIDEESSQTKTAYFCILVQVRKMNQFHGLYVYWTIHMHAWHQQHAINGIRCT